MHELKIRKIGNAVGTIFPKDLANALNVEEGDTLYVVKAADGSVRLTPYDPAFEQQMAAARKGAKKYRNALRELAK